MKNKKPPFDGTEDALRMAREYADIVIVTAANRQEINKEWEFFELAQYTDLLMSQETGRKEDCLRELLDKGYDGSQVSMQGLGYKEFLPYFAGEISLEDAVTELKTGTRRFAKRQLTWFRRNKSIHWLIREGDQGLEEILKQARQILWESDTPDVLA